ncbi:MAG TPA: hypothetical protein VLA66_09870 [Thermoanaerobaculia bacterium]|nr:hypothetical protein [Thermoanaerobaculia bacterium]
MPRANRPSLRTLCAGLLWLLASSTPALADGVGLVGPDVTVYSLSGIGNYGGAAGYHGYSLGTTSCNIGDQPVNWCDNFGGCSGLGWEQHPVIGQNLYRLKDGRFSQIGASWLKHGFLSTNSNAGTSCTGPGGQTCTIPPRGGNELGIGCTDTYGSSLNGSRPLGMPAEVNPTTGLFPFPETIIGTSTVVDQRMKVADADLDPALNPGALYWGEGHYISDNDALANNAFNNASYRPVTVTAGTLDLSFTGSTIRERWAFDVWQVQDPAVETIRLEFASDGGATLEGFNVGRRVTDLGGGNWHYEYVVHNMNSNRAAQALAIDFVDGASVTNIGFEDYDHHSGEYEPSDGMPISTTDWATGFDGGTGVVSWETETYAVSPHANALRWSTMYNFWFDADMGPDEIASHTLALFKPGTPSSISFWESPTTPDIFSDGFETGDTSRWSSASP